MSKHLDVDRSIAEWLVAEEPDHAPARLLEASRARVRTTAQRRSLRPVRRYLSMNTPAKLAIAAAAVVVMAVVGMNVAPRLGLGETNATSSPASPTAAAPVAPVEFTGRWNCGPGVRVATTETLDVGDDGTVLTRDRDGAWVQAVTMSDPRLEGTVHNTYESDMYRAAGAAEDGPTVSAYTFRITNDGGTWESRGFEATFADGTVLGEVPAVDTPAVIGEVILVGGGGYEGLIAIFEVTAANTNCEVEVRGVIFQGAPMPEPYIAQ